MEDHMATTEQSSISNRKFAAAPATDPVCGMQVESANESLTMAYKGHEHKFCSSTCRDTFRANPEKFV
jgi:Cu+-exporting ATPase